MSSSRVVVVVEVIKKQKQIKPRVKTSELRRERKEVLYVLTKKKPSRQTKAAVKDNSNTSASSSVCIFRKC